MTLSIGSNLNLLINGDPGEEHYSQLMRQWRGLDTLVQPRVISATMIVPPGNPADGDCYIVPGNASGVWAGRAGQISRWSALLCPATWEFFAPQDGWQVWVLDMDQPYNYKDGKWRLNPAGFNAIQLPEKPLDRVPYTPVMAKRIGRLLGFGDDGYPVGQCALLVPDDAPSLVLPPVAARASSILGFNDIGQPVGTIPQSGSAADVLIKLASVGDGLGDQMIGVQKHLDGATPTNLDAWIDGASVNATTEFGADNKGNTCAYTAIQSAIDTVAARGGGNVLLSHGIYLLSETLYIPPFVHLIGEGSFSFVCDPKLQGVTGTVIKYTSADLTSAAIRLNGFIAATGERYTNNDRATLYGGAALDAGLYTQCFDASVQNLTIVSTAGHQYGVLMLGAPKSYLQRVAAHGFQYDFYHQASWGTRLIHCHANNPLVNGFYFGSNSNAFQVDNCYVSGPITGGNYLPLVCYGCYGGTFNTCIFETGTSFGVELSGCYSMQFNTPWLEGLQFTDAFHFNDSYGITILSPYLNLNATSGCFVTVTIGCQAIIKNVRGNYYKTIRTPLCGYEQLSLEGFPPKPADNMAELSVGQIDWKENAKTFHIPGLQHERRSYLPAGGYVSDLYMVDNNLRFSLQRDAKGLSILNDQGNLRFRFDVSNNSVVIAGGLQIANGSGSPEGVVTAMNGSMYLRNDGAKGTTFYVKETGTGNTGWVAK